MGGAVAWGLLGHRPVPIPAHETGRADFRYPAGFTAKHFAVKLRVFDTPLRGLGA
jgi:hypothetical protein